MTEKGTKGNRGEVPGIKVLITASTLAATLSGWAILGLRDARASAGAQASSGSQTLSPELLALMEPLPTVVPPPAYLNVVAPIEQPTPMRRILRSVSIPPPPPPQPDGHSHSSR
jgi:hypothetical protein